MYSSKALCDSIEKELYYVIRTYLVENMLLFFILNINICIIRDYNIVTYMNWFKLTYECICISVGMGNYLRRRIGKLKGSVYYIAL